MIGRSCINCGKIIREHTKKTRIAKNSADYKNLLQFYRTKGKGAILKRTCDCCEDGEHIVLLFPLDDKNNIYIVEKIGKLYQLTYCSNECRNEHERHKKEQKLERARHKHIINKLFPQIKERCNNCCVYCGSTDKLEVHHIEPFSLGGKADLDNFVLLCKDCHLIVSDKSSSKTKKWIYDDYFKSKINPAFLALRKNIINKLDKYKIALGD